MRKALICLINQIIVLKARKEILIEKAMKAYMKTHDNDLLDDIEYYRTFYDTKIMELKVKWKTERRYNDEQIKSISVSD